MLLDILILSLFLYIILYVICDFKIVKWCKHTRTQMIMCKDVEHILEP